MFKSLFVAMSQSPRLVPILDGAAKFQAMKSIMSEFQRTPSALRNTFHSFNKFLRLELFHSCDFCCRNGINTHVLRLIISRADALDFFSFISRAEFPLTQIYFLSTFFFFFKISREFAYSSFALDVKCFQTITSDGRQITKRRN